MGTFLERNLTAGKMPTTSVRRRILLIASTPLSHHRHCAAPTTSSIERGRSTLDVSERSRRGCGSVRHRDLGEALPLVRDLLRFAGFLTATVPASGTRRAAASGCRSRRRRGCADSWLPAPGVLCAISFAGRQGHTNGCWTIRTHACMLGHIRVHRCAGHPASLDPTTRIHGKRRWRSDIWRDSCAGDVGRPQGDSIAWSN